MAVAVAAASSSSSSSSSTGYLLNLRRRPRSNQVAPAYRPTSAAFLRPAATLREAESDASLATTWRKVQGADNWTGLVEPLSPLLRDVLVHYGELAMACYKAFDLDPASPTHLRCKYRRPHFMAEVGLGAAGYEVTRYVYATPPDAGLPLRRRTARWIGYVAVSSDAARRRLGRRDVLVAFRGTATGAEWAANLMSSLAPADLGPRARGRGVEVESGFLGLYTAGGRGSCREQLLGEVGRLVREHEGEEMSITLAGHSMGSALAVLLGYDLAELGVAAGAGAGHEVPVTVYSFGGPRVGNGVFRERCEELGVKVLRVANVRDPVTKLPGLFMNERRRPWPRWSSSCYAHVGVEVAVECSGRRRNPMRVHDLETYLGLLRSPPETVEAEEELQAWPWPWQVRNLVQSLGLI